MVHKFAEKISRWNADSLKLSESERQVIEYGIEVFTDGLIKLMLLGMIGVGLGKTAEILCAVFVFCGLRYWAGGIHCKTNMGCLIAMIFISVISLYGAEMLQNVPQILKATIMIFCLVTIIWKAPGQTDYTPRLSELNERKKRKGAVIFILLLYILIFLMKDAYWKALILFSIFFEILSIIPCKGNITNFLSRRRAV